MDIQSAKNEIKNTIRAYLKVDEFGQFVIDVTRQRPIYLLGAPGIGKTAIMEQIAEELDLGLVAYSITHHTRQSALGLPFISDKKFRNEEFRITEYTMSEIIAAVYDKIEKSGNEHGILFIDEINSASETLAPTMLQFLQSKIFGTHRVPAGWVIVAAGNPPEYNKSVKEFDIVTMDRVKKMEIEPDLEVWKKYAYSKRVHTAILNYLDLFKQNFYFAENSVDGMMIVTPRGWEDLSQIMHLYEDLQIHFTEELISQYIQHPRVAKDFFQYYSLYLKYQEKIDIYQILEGKADPSEFKDLANIKADEKIAVVNLFVDALAQKFYAYNIDFGVIKKTLEYLKNYKQRVNSQYNDTFNEQFLKNINSEIDGLINKALDSNKKVLLNTKKLINEIFNYLPKQSDAVNSFSIIKERYDLKLSQLNLLAKETNQSITRAIKFLEELFGNNNELFIFMSELTVNPFSVKFLNENRNNDYLEYSQMLLIGDQSKKIMDEINQISPQITDVKLN